MNILCFFHMHDVDIRDLGVDSFEESNHSENTLAPAWQHAGMRQEYTSIEEMSFTLAGTPQIFWYDDLSIEKPIIFLYFSEIPKIFFL